MADKILLIDDEIDFVETLAERMRSRDMNVSTSTSAKEALEKIDKESFDAIVLDLQMPGMDGLEALKHIKEKNPKLQVILLTGQSVFACLFIHSSTNSLYLSECWIFSVALLYFSLIALPKSWVVGSVLSNVLPPLANLSLPCMACCSSWRVVEVASPLLICGFK